MVRRGWFRAATLALVTLGPNAARADDAKSRRDPPAWCAPELETLPGDVCYFPAPADAGSRTLVIFLHGLIKPDSTWQWSQQRSIVRQAKHLGFSVLAPRGRRGVGPGGMSAVAWPLSASAQQSVEQELIDEWLAARKLVETRDKKPFDEVFVVGFSNGAYFASTLALRERVGVDGYALFAGGSTTEPVRKAGAAATHRVPIFVAVASDDPTSSRDSQNFAALLDNLRWPHKVSVSSVGHAVADHQLDIGMKFLRAEAKRAKVTGPDPRAKAQGR